MKTIAIIIIILILAVLTALFVISLVVCASADDELTRKLDDAEQAGEVEDKAHLDAFTRLAANMNKMAITQKRIQPKKVNAENEKYALRIWLIRLGMNGDDYKADRKILMEHLSGHAAFRTDAEKDKWTARQQAKREALKASREAAEA